MFHVPLFILHLVLEKIAHDVERVLQRFGIARGARVLAAVECGHAEDNLIGVRIIGAAVATRRNWAIAHEAVRGERDLWHRQTARRSVEIRSESNEMGEQLKAKWLTCVQLEVLVLVLLLVQKLNIKTNVVQRQKSE